MTFFGASGATAGPSAPVPPPTLSYGARPIPDPASPPRPAPCAAGYAPGYVLHRARMRRQLGEGSSGGEYAWLAVSLPRLDARLEGCVERWQA